MTDDIDAILAKYRPPAGEAGASDIDAIVAKYRPAPPRLSDVGPYRDGFRAPAAPDVPKLPPRESLPENRPQLPDVPTSIARRLLQGATFSYSDEAAAAIETALGKVGLGEPTKYAERRDQLRGANAAAAERLGPVGTFAADVTGNMLTTRGYGAATVPLRIAKAAGQGALYASGASEADLTKDEVKPLLRDAVIGGAVGTVAGAAGEGVSKMIKKGAAAVTDALKRRVLNEVAEGTATTTATGRKKLDAAGEAIVREVVQGPSAKRVRSAYTGDAEAGVKTLQPIIASVGKKLERAYQTFEERGRGVIDIDDYMDRLAEQAAQAQNRGQLSVMRGIEAFSQDVREFAARTGELTLRQLRGLTSETQRAAASTLGSLNEHASAKLAKRLSAVASQEMAETLAKQAGDDKVLRAALTTIRQNNPRYHALATIEETLKQRVYKENTGKSAIVRAAEKVATPAATGAALGALSSEDRLEGALQGAAAGAALRYGIPAAARGLDRRLTTEAIAAARGEGTVTREVARRLAEAAARYGAGTAASRAVEPE